MNQKTFLSDLEKNLSERNIDDIAGIVEEYEEHFKFKPADRSHHRSLRYRNSHRAAAGCCAF